MRLLAYILAILVAGFGCRETENKAPDQNHIPVLLNQNSADDNTSFGDLYGNPLPPNAIGRLGSTRMLDRGIRQMIFTPDGRQAVATHQDGFQIWNLSDASREKLLPHKFPGNLMTVSPNGKQLATTTTVSGQIVVWNLESGKIVTTLRTNKENLIGLCFVSDETVISASTVGTITSVELPDKESSAQVFRGPWLDASTFACAAQAGWLAIGTKSGNAYILRIGSDDPIKLGTADKMIRTAAIASDGSTFAFGSEDAKIYLWNSPTPKSRIVIPAHDRTVLNLAFTSDNRTLYSSGGDWWFRAWNPKNGAQIQETPGVFGLKAQHMVLSPIDNLMISWSLHSGERGSEAGRWWLWNSKSGTPLLEPTRHSQGLTSIAFSPDGARLATASADRSVRLWDAKSTESIKMVADAAGSINDVVWAPDGKSLYSSGVDALVNRWFWPKNTKNKILVEGVGGAVNRIVITKNGARAITGDQIGRVWSWDLRSGNRIQAYDRRGYSAIYDLAVSPNGQHLAAAGNDPLIRIVNLTNGKEIARLDPESVSANFAVTFSPDGQVLASGSDRHSIHLWNTNDWTEIKTIDGHDGTIRCLDYSSDGRWLASGGTDQVIRVWDTKSGDELTKYTGHQGAITDIAFSPDDRILASASSDSTALLWKLP